MPVGELIEFGVRLGFDVLLAVGGGDTRAAAVSRAAVFGVAAILSVPLERIEAATSKGWLVAVSAVLGIIGAYLVWRLVQQIRLLVRWGEPMVMASPEGLILVKRDRVLPWDEIASLTPESRGPRSRVRIGMAKKSQADVFIATRDPEALAHAIRGVDVLKGRLG